MSAGAIECFASVSRRGLAEIVALSGPADADSATLKVINVEGRAGYASPFF